MFAFLAGLVAALLMFASGIGLGAGNLYRDNALVRAAWFGNDLVTLLVAGPLLLVAILLARRGSRNGLLLALGMLAYSAYNYAFYLFGSAYNDLFLVYAAILSASILGLISGLSSSQLKAVLESVRVRPVDRAVGVVIALVASGLGAFWLSMSVASLVSGAIPAMVLATDHPTNVTAALDLSLVATFGLLGGIWLARSKPWGYVVAAIWATKSVVYMLALSAATYVAFRRELVESPVEMTLWLTICLVSILSLVVLLRRPRSGAA